MDVTASDVEQVRFPQGRKGYDPDVVDQFLDRVAATLRNWDERMRELSARNQSLEAQLNEQRESEAIMRRTLQVAQRAADETVAEAQARARDLVATAEATAQEAERRAAERVREMELQLKKERQLVEADIEALRQYYHDFIERISQVINDFAGLLQRAETIGSEKPPVLSRQPAREYDEVQKEPSVGPPQRSEAPAPAAPATAPAAPATAPAAPATPATSQQATQPAAGERPEVSRAQPPPPPQPKVAPPRIPGATGSTQVIDDFGVRDAEPPRPATAPEIPEE